MGAGAKVGWSIYLCPRELRGGLTEEEEKFKLIRGRRRKEENSKTQKKQLCVWKVGGRQVWLKPACMEDLAGCEWRRRGWV